MTQQEMIDRDIRMLVGDMQVQLIFARARIAELEQQLADAAPKQGKPNGVMQEHERQNAAAPPQ